MKRILVIIIVIQLLILGCGLNRLAGTTWEYDFPGYATSYSFERGWQYNGGETYSLSFSKTRYSLNTGGPVVTGTYKISVDDIILEFPDGSQVTGSVIADRFVMQPDDGPSIEFKQIK